MLERPLQASKSSFRSTAARVAKVGHGQCAKEIVRLGALCKGLFEDVSELIQLISWRLGLPIHKEVSKSLQGVGSVRDNRHALEVGREGLLGPCELFKDASHQELRSPNPPRKGCRDAVFREGAFEIPFQPQRVSLPQ